MEYLALLMFPLLILILMMGFHVAFSMMGAPNYSQLGFRVHPPKPPQGGLSCSLLPLAALHNMHASQQTTWRFMGSYK